MQIQTLTSNAFWGHALGENAYLVHVRSETDQDGVRRDTFLLRNLLRDFVVSEGRSGRPKRGVSRDGDPLRLGEFHKFDLVDGRDDRRVLQEPLEVAHAPVGNLMALILSGFALYIFSTSL